MQGNHLRFMMRARVSLRGRWAVGAVAPVLITQPCQHGCRLIANGGALNSVSADYDGVIRMTLENPDPIRRGFWAGRARHYHACGPLMTRFRSARLPGRCIKPSAWPALSSIRCQVQSWHRSVPRVAGSIAASGKLSTASTVDAVDNSRLSADPPDKNSAVQMTPGFGLIHSDQVFNC